MNNSLQGTLLTSDVDDEGFGVYNFTTALGKTGRIVVRKEFKTRWVKNPVSGHSWPEYEETSRVELQYPQGTEKFRSLKAALASKDYWLKFYLGGFGAFE